MSKDLWVSADGSWGVNKVEKFDTTNWQDKDWDRLDAECDSLKLSLAKYITRKRNRQAKKVQALVDGFQATEVRTFIIGNDGSIIEDNGGDVVTKNCCDYCDGLLKDL
jgi:hypothetical protein